MKLRALSLALALTPVALWAQEADPTPQPDPLPEAQIEGPMTLERMALIIQTIDADVRAQGPTLQFTLDGIPVMIVADAAADRMRAMVPIASAEGLSEADLLRMMQANFDTALDARYAVANGRLWGVFIHPLSPLEKDQLLSALIQTVNVARSYGRTYSGGAQTFGGGDSAGIYRELFEELKKKGEAL
ncbi:hypothetical protein KDD17_10460 [Sulfitobacter albidus]|uniref:YbjN domain-containing protein n=1 Tax=Sulfitobacter albidus TaxID=2829501 RepID=A0A975JBP5_9RHOB|nr:hypothetical protein [Sulfitobacter albidus]QUJ75402.1 hypothetical protein KDD17_10460 [Sulfitobacter albidus]